MCVELTAKIPGGEYLVRLGKAGLKRQGKDVTVVAMALHGSSSPGGCRRAEKKGRSMEVIEPRTLAPLDKETIIGSAKKTGR